MIIVFYSEFHKIIGDLSRAFNECRDFNHWRLKWLKGSFLAPLIVGSVRPLMGELIKNNFSCEDSFRSPTQHFSTHERNLS